MNHEENQGHEALLLPANFSSCSPDFLRVEEKAGILFDKKPLLKSSAPMLFIERERAAKEK